jgi:hypothetical protein
MLTFRLNSKTRSTFLTFSERSKRDFYFLTVQVENLSLPVFECNMHETGLKVRKSKFTRLFGFTYNLRKGLSLKKKVLNRYQRLRLFGHTKVYFNFCNKPCGL